MEPKRVAGKVLGGLLLMIAMFLVVSYHASSARGCTALLLVACIFGAWILVTK